MTTKKTLLALVTAMFVLGLSGAAFAQEGVTETEGKDGYGYTFNDDPLQAGGFGPNDAQIRVRENAAKATLIKPRTSFVPELRKSVENL